MLLESLALLAITQDYEATEAQSVSVSSVAHHITSSNPNTAAYPNIRSQLTIQILQIASPLTSVVLHLLLGLLKGQE